MMLQHGLSITVLLFSAGLAAPELQQGRGWLDRVVQFQKNKLFNEIKELAPINMNVELRQKPEGYDDSRHWDYESVMRLLTLIRQSEKAKPVLKALRRMLQPTRRIMMSIKQSMQKFPSLKDDDTNFVDYYDVDYASAEGNENAIPPHVAVPADQAVIIVSNPVEARLPSAQISVKLLREILEARARAARQMPTSTVVVPWIEFIKNRTTTEATTITTEESTDADEDGESTTAAEDDTAAGDDTIDATTAAEEETIGDTDATGADTATVADTTVADATADDGSNTVATGDATTVATADGATTPEPES